LNELSSDPAAKSAFNGNKSAECKNMPAFWKILEYAVFNVAYKGYILNIRGANSMVEVRAEKLTSTCSNSIEKLITCKGKGEL
jgi:hypothetical protein